MAEEQNRLQERLDNIVSGHSRKAREAAEPAPTLRAARERAPKRRGRPFSSFIPEDVQAAVDLASELMRVSESAGGGEQGLSAALDAAEARLAGEHAPPHEIAERAPGAAPTHPRGLTQHALKLFVTHYEPARQRLRLHSLERRQPGLVRPTAKPENAAPAAPEAAPEAEEPETAGRPVATPPEDRVSFWREDPLINEHHEHWHLVYPTAGRPSPGGGFALGDRHGELFAYMHEQMLARYDAERLAQNLQRVAPFADYAAPVPEGYDPGDLMLWDGGEWTLWGPRPAGAAWSDLTGDFATRPGATIAKQEAFYQAMTEAATTGTYSRLATPAAVDINNLGDAEEANTNSPDYYGKADPKNFQTYGNHHNDGHIHFMAFDNQEPYGVMATTATAVRDPVFFRWHKEVDTVYQAYQDTRAPYDFSTGPRVRIRTSAGPDGASSPDILLVRNASGAAVDEQALAAALFGDGAAGAPGAGAAAGLSVTSELLTEMRQRQVELQDAQGNPVLETIDYLSHEDFLYAFRVENLADGPQDLAVRVFLAPEPQVDDRAAWIEMDRFTYRLTGRYGLIVRRSEDSSVVRKPALKPADLEPGDEPSPKTEQQPWCDCGWPYTLLLPRGTGGGMGFRLYVMFSDGADLSMPPQPGKCTSLSYCGLQDQDYPDKREMGYPFNRPFAAPIPETVAAHDNMGWTSITIRCTNLPPAPPAVGVAVEPGRIAQPQPDPA